MGTKIILSFVVASLGIVAAAPPAENYKVDPAHSRLGFSVRHMGINNVKGCFDEFAGSIVLENGAIKEADCTIQAKSINTGVTKRDDHLRTADFFDAAKFPTITFKTTKIEKKDGQTTLVADMTMRGVKKEVRLPVTVSGPVKDQSGAMRIGFEGKLTLNRKDFGINYNAALESGVAMVGEQVAIEIDVEAVLQKPEEK
jgi:polyisoprenoid-binding protein YceI